MLQRNETNYFLRIECNTRNYEISISVNAGLHEDMIIAMKTVVVVVMVMIKKAQLPLEVSSHKNAVKFNRLRSDFFHLVKYLPY
jgi:hypothetical protein